MHAMMHLVWFAIPLFSADRTRAVPIGSLVPLSAESKCSNVRGLEYLVGTRDKNRFALSVTWHSSAA
jgi:hypothetical protein